MADRVAGGFVSGHGQQDEERRDLSRRQPFAVDLGGYQCGGQIIARVGPAILGKRGGIGADIDGDLHEFFVVGREIRVSEAEDDVGPVEDLLMVIIRDAHHVADHLEGQRSGQFGHQFAPAVGVVGDQFRNQLAGAIANRFLGSRDHLRREGTAHDIA